MQTEDDDLQSTLAELRQLPRPRPAARARLRHALNRSPRPVRPIRWRSALLPLAAAAGLAALVLTAVFSSPPDSPAAPRLAGAPARAGRQPVQFVLVAGSANRVTLVGDFNDWDPDALPLRRDAGGVWSVVLPLPAGRFTYSFLVDGREWVADPGAPRVAGDDFGRPSSVLLVAGAET